MLHRDTAGHCASWSEMHRVLTSHYLGRNGYRFSPGRITGADGPFGPATMVTGHDLAGELVGVQPSPIPRPCLPAAAVVSLGWLVGWARRWWVGPAGWWPGWGGGRVERGAGPAYCGGGAGQPAGVFADFPVGLLGR